MSSIIASLSGAPGAASTAGNYYQQAMQNLINATGSPAASIFGKEEAAGLNPLFADQTQNLLGAEAASGTLGSGQGRQGLNSLVSGQGSTLAGAVAPLYQSALQQYGNIDAAMPGAQNSAYQDAIQQFYNGVGQLGSAAGMAFGIPSFSSTGAPGSNPATSSQYSTVNSNPNPYASA